jgi:hypothetical protein
LDDLDLEEMIIKLNGALLRKAEIENSFSKFYLDVFKRLTLFYISEEFEILELFGNMGG